MEEEPVEVAAEYDEYEDGEEETDVEEGMSTDSD